MSVGISIISITRNDIDGITRTLKSTSRLRQLINDWDIEFEQIVVDGSDDSTAESVRLIAEREERVRYIREQQPGISKAFNSGIQQSSGEWVWLLNGGDELLPDAPLNLLLETLTRTGSDLVIFAGRSGGKRQHTRPMSKLWPVVYCWIIHNAVIMRRSIMEEFGGYREDFHIAMDAELWIRVFGYHKRADVIDIPLINFEGGGVSSDIERRAPECVRMLWDNKRLLWNGMFYYPKICWEAWRTYKRNARAFRKRGAK